MITPENLEEWKAIPNSNSGESWPDATRNNSAARAAMPLLIAEVESLDEYCTSLKAGCDRRAIQIDSLNLRGYRLQVIADKLKAELVESATNGESAINNLYRDKVRLQTIVDKYPKTADGVPLVPGMKLYMKFQNRIVFEEVANWNQGYEYYSSGYSTREAAEAEIKSESTA